MSIICMRCKPSKPGPRKLVPSRVIESRVIHSHVLVNGRSTRTRTMRRRRECLGCGFRWTTLEYAEPAKRGASHGQFGKTKTKETNSERQSVQ
ncbi:hypothetical protein HAP48_0043030 [Bradyrhizobium septentrionale]|uniref:Uncharacterized protein n=1 Tax=Bradyrhizobium septentrionale TaxID=1404411 RepID=A0A974A2Y2_9BRAD|nr:hypothetical protein [Bradyrhizobium septentrionale]UGY15233.1 hypothetical protein HAP48_0043030 [Bradyrhizobium septentrionale]UGY23816.1 hypothetical protein HU675_0038695 [Bradyrhizobium septentrionale]